MRHITEIDKLMAGYMSEVLRERLIDLGDESACITALIGHYRPIDIINLIGLAIEKAKRKPQTAEELP